MHPLFSLTELCFHIMLNYTHQSQVLSARHYTGGKAIHRIPGHWLFAGDRPIVHLIGSQGHGLDGAAEAFDHVGIHMEGYTEFRARLERMGIRYSPMDLPELDERRLFFRTPSGPLIETVFHEPMPKPQEQVQ